MVPAHRENNVFTWKSRDLLRRIGMVFQEPEHQFVTSSVSDEVAVGPKSMGKTDDEAYAIADMMLTTAEPQTVRPSQSIHVIRRREASPFRGVHACRGAEGVGDRRADIRSGFHHMDGNGQADSGRARRGLFRHHGHS